MQVGASTQQCLSLIVIDQYLVVTFCISATSQSENDATSTKALKATTALNVIKWIQSHGNTYMKVARILLFQLWLLLDNIYRVPPKTCNESETA